MPNDDKLKQIWNKFQDPNTGLQNYMQIPEYDVFKQVFNDPNKRKVIYDKIKSLEPNINLTLPDYDQFELIGLNKLDSGNNDKPGWLPRIVDALFSFTGNPMQSIETLKNVGSEMLVGTETIVTQPKPFIRSKINEFEKGALNNPDLVMGLTGSAGTFYKGYAEPQVQRTLNEKETIEKDIQKSIRLKQIDKELGEDYAEMYNQKKRAEQRYIAMGVLDPSFPDTFWGNQMYSLGMNLPFVVAGGAGNAAVRTAVTAAGYPLFTIAEANSLQGEVYAATGKLDKDGLVIPGSGDVEKTMAVGPAGILAGLFEFFGPHQAIKIFRQGSGAALGWKIALKDIGKVGTIEGLEEGYQNSIEQLSKMGVGVQEEFSAKEMLENIGAGAVGGLMLGIPGTIFNQSQIQQVRDQIVNEMPKVVNQLEGKKVITPKKAEAFREAIKAVEETPDNKDLAQRFQNIQEHFVEAFKENQTRIKKIQAFAEYNDDIAKRGNELFKERVSLMTPQPGEDYQAVIQKGFESEDLANKFIEKLAENPVFQEFKAKVAPQLQGMEPEQINGEIYRSILNIPSKKFEAPETLRNLFWNGYRLVLRDELDAKERAKPNQAEDIRETAFPVDDDVLFQFEKNDRRPSRTGPVSGLTGVNWDEVSYGIGTTNRINIRGKKSTPRWYWYFEKMDDASAFMTEKNTEWNAPVLKWSKQNQRVETDFNVTRAIANGTYNQETPQFQKDNLSFELKGSNVIPFNNPNMVNVTSKFDDWIGKQQGKIDLSQPFKVADLKGFGQRLVEQFRQEYVAKNNFTSVPKERIADFKKDWNKWLKNKFGLKHKEGKYDDEGLYGLGRIINYSKMPENKGTKESTIQGSEVIISGDFLLKDMPHEYTIGNQEGAGLGWYIYSEINGEPFIYEFQSDILPDLFGKSVSSTVKTKDDKNNVTVETETLLSGEVRITDKDGTKYYNKNPKSLPGIKKIVFNTEVKLGKEIKYYDSDGSFLKIISDIDEQELPIRIGIEKKGNVKIYTVDYYWNELHLKNYRHEVPFNNPDNREFNSREEAFEFAKEILYNYKSEVIEYNKKQEELNTEYLSSVKEITKREFETKKEELSKQNVEESLKNFTIDRPLEFEYDGKLYSATYREVVNKHPETRLKSIRELYRTDENAKYIHYTVSEKDEEGYWGENRKEITREEYLEKFNIDPNKETIPTLENLYKRYWTTWLMHSFIYAKQRGHNTIWLPTGEAMYEIEDSMKTAEMYATKWDVGKTIDETDEYNNYIDTIIAFDKVGPYWTALNKIKGIKLELAQPEWSIVPLIKADISGVNTEAIVLFQKEKPVQTTTPAEKVSPAQSQTPKTAIQGAVTVPQLGAELKKAGVIDDDIEPFGSWILNHPWNQDVKVQWVDSKYVISGTNTMEGARGAYFNGTVYLNKSMLLDKNMYDTAAHESMHPFLNRALKENSQFRIEMEEIYKEVKLRLSTDLIDEYKRNQKDFDEALKNLPEFLTYVMTNTSQIHQWAKRTALSNKGGSTILQRVYSVVKRLLIRLAKRDANLSQQIPTFYDAIETLLSKWYGAPSTIDYWDILTDELNDNVKVDSAESQAEMFNSNAQAEDLRASRALAQLLQSKPKYAESARMDPIAFIQSMSFKEFSRALRDEPDFITYITAKKGSLLPSMKFDEYVKRNLKQIYEIAKSQEMNPVIYINMTNPENPTVEEMGDYYTGRGHTNASSWKPKILMKQIMPELNKLFGNEFTMMFVDGVKLKGDRAIGLNDKLVLFEQGEKTEPPRNQFYADVLQKNGYIFLGTFADKQTGIALKPKNKIDPNTIIQLRKMYDERIVNMLNKLQNNAKVISDIGDPNSYRGQIDNIQEDMKSGYLYQRLIRLVSEDIKLGAKVLGPGQLQSVMYNPDDSNTYDAKKLLKRPTLISQMRYTIQDDETVKDILAKTKGYGISQKNKELFGRTYIFKADPKPGEWISKVKFHGRELDIDFHYALVNDLGTETTDGILYVLEKGGDYAYKELHGVLKGGSKKMWVGNQHGEDPMFFKGSMQIISEDSILGHWMRQNKVTFLVSSTTAKYAMGSIQQSTLQALEAGDETGIFDMPFKNINRIYEKDSENEAVKGLQQSLNANMNVPGNKYFVDMGIDEFTDDVIGFLVKDYEKSVRMMDTAAIIKRMRDRALNGVSVPERTIAQVFLDLTYNTAARQANEATDDRELKYKRMVTRRMSDEKLAQTLGKVMLHPAFSRPVKGWLRDELSKVYSFKTSLEWQTLRPDIGWLDDAVLESLWNQLEGTEEEKWKLFEERIDMKSGRLKQGWAYMSESAERLGLKINDKDIISIVPSTSLYSQYAIKIAGFIPKGIAELDSVVMNSEDIQSRGGRDFDIDQLLNFFLNEDRVSPSAYNKYWEMIKATSEKHQKEMLKDYKRILKDEKVQLKGGNYLDIRNMTERDMYDPAVQIALVRKLTGTERPANNIVNPLIELFNINDKFLSPVSEAVSPRKKMTLLASIGAKSSVNKFKLNANNKELSDTYLLFERLTNDFVDTPNNTNSFFYDVGPYRTTDKIWGIKQGGLQGMSEDEESEAIKAKEINRGINMAVDFLFSHAININSDSINVDDPNTSRGLPEDIYYIRMQQRIMELLKDGNKPELIRMFQDYVGERLVLDKKKPQNYRILEYGEEFIENFEYEDLMKSAELKAVSSIDLTILPNAILTREKYIDWETKVLRNMMFDSPYAKLAESIFKTAPEVKRFASKPNKYLMTAYMLTAHNRKVHNIKNSLISIMLPVDQRQRDITEMEEGTYYDNTFNITNFDVFPALLSKILKRRSIRFKDTSPSRQVLDFPSGAQIELTRGVNDVLVIRATNVKGVTARWDSGYDFLMDNTNLGNSVKRALGFNIDKEGNPMLPAPVKMIGEVTTGNLEQKLREQLKRKVNDIGQRIVPRTADEIKMLAYSFVEENIPNTSAERKLDVMHHLIKVIKESPEVAEIKARSKAMYKINEMFSFGRNINVEDRLNLAEQYLNKVLPLMTEEEKDLMFMSLLGHPDQSDKNLPKTGLISPLNLVNSERKKRMDNEYDYTTQQHFVELLARTGQKGFLNKYFTYLEKYYPGLGFADRIQILNDIESNDDILSGERVWYSKSFEEGVANEKITKVRKFLDVFKASLWLPRKYTNKKFLTPNLLSGRATFLSNKDVFQRIVTDATNFSGAINSTMVAYAHVDQLYNHMNAYNGLQSRIQPAVNAIIGDIEKDTKQTKAEIWRDINLLRDKGVYGSIVPRHEKGIWIFKYNNKDFADLDKLASEVGLEQLSNRLRFKAVMELAKIFDSTNIEVTSNLTEYLKHVMNQLPEDFGYLPEVAALYNKWATITAQFKGRAGRYFARTFKPDIYLELSRRAAAYDLLKSRYPEEDPKELHKRAREWDKEPEDFKTKVEKRSIHYTADASKGTVHSWMKKRSIPDDLVDDVEFITDNGEMHWNHQEELFRAIKSDVMKVLWWQYENETRRAGIDDKYINMMHEWFINEIHDSVFKYQKVNYNDVKPGDGVAFWYTNRRGKSTQYRGVVKELGKDFVKLDINDAVYEVKTRDELNYYKEIHNNIATNSYLNGNLPATSNQLEYLKGLNEAGYVDDYDRKTITKAQAAEMIYRGLEKQLADKANWGKFEKRRIFIKQYVNGEVVQKIGFEKNPYGSRIAKYGTAANQIVTASYLTWIPAGFKNITDAGQRVSQALGYFRFFGINRVLHGKIKQIKEGNTSSAKFVAKFIEKYGIDKRFAKDDQWIALTAWSKMRKFSDAMKTGNFQEYDTLYRKAIARPMSEQSATERIETAAAIAAKSILEIGAAKVRVGGSSDYLKGDKASIVEAITSTLVKDFETAEGFIRRLSTFLGVMKAVVIEGETDLNRIQVIAEKYVERANSRYAQYQRKFGDAGWLGKMAFKFSQFNADQLNNILMQIEMGKQQGQIQGVFDKLTKGQLLEAASALGFNIKQIFKREGIYTSPAEYGLPEELRVTHAKAGSSTDPMIMRRLVKEAFQDTVVKTIIMPFRGLRTGNPVVRPAYMLMVFLSNLIFHGEWPDDYDLSDWIADIFGMMFGWGIQIPVQWIMNIAMEKENPISVGNPRIYSFAAEAYSLAFTEEEKDFRGSVKDHYDYLQQKWFKAFFGFNPFPHTRRYYSDALNELTQRNPWAVGSQIIDFDTYVPIYNLMEFYEK